MKHEAIPNAVFRYTYTPNDQRPNQTDGKRSDDRFPAVAFDQVEDQWEDQVKLNDHRNEPKVLTERIDIGFVEHFEKQQMAEHRRQPISTIVYEWE